MLKACHDLKSFEEVASVVSDSVRSLLALRFLQEGGSLAEIQAKIARETWAHRLEISCRYLWMSFHAKLISAGDAPESPFSCVVGDRGSMERAGDREYYQLLLYLHARKLDFGDEWLPLKKGETPDFIVDDSHGSRIGVEVGEAPKSQAWADAQDCAECVFRAIRRLVRSQRVILTFLEPFDWQAVSKEILPFRAWLKEEILGLPARMQHCRDIRFQSADCQVTIERARTGMILSHDPEGLSGDDVDRLTLDLAAGIRFAVHKKLFKTEPGGGTRERKRPSIRPCHLVLYPNDDSGADVARSCELVRLGPPLNASSHFDSVWVSNENLLLQIA